MPEISRFYGIAIYLRYNDHNPPHFHAKYGKYKAVFSIKELKLMEGNMPPRAISHILEWAFLHRDELMKDWNLARENAPLNKIKGLE